MRRLYLTAFMMMQAATGMAGSTTELAGDVIALGLLPGSALLCGYKQSILPTFAKSYGSTVATTTVLKEVIHAERPNKKDNRSFPSLHTASAFSGAAFLSSYCTNKALGVMAYALAGYAGYTRVKTDHHYTHDVLAGAAIGIGFNELFKVQIPNKNTMALRYHYSF